MSHALRSPLRLRAAVVVLVLVGLVAVVLVAGGGGATVRGLPARVQAEVGSDPVVVSLHGDVLAMISRPDVDALARLETRVGHDPRVAGEYGVARWLTDRIGALARSARRRATAQAPLSAQLVRAGASGSASLGDGSLTSSLVFGTGTTPQHSLAWLIPDASTARLLISPAAGVDRGALGRSIAHAVAALQLPGITATVAQG